MVDATGMMLTLDGAIVETIRFLKEKALSSQVTSHYGYDLYAPMLAQDWSARNFRNDTMMQAQVNAAAVPLFMEAAWELCRRGIVRPGVAKSNAQGIPGGNGYTLTTYGRAWLENADESDWIVTQTGSLAQTFATFRGRYGDAYHQRTQEALICREAQAWLACCALAGAAAESVLLAAANARFRDENKVRSVYNRASGRTTLLNGLVGDRDKYVRETFKTYMGILAYWRDDAAHGQAINLSLASADEAIRQLLHLSQWTEKQWDKIVNG